MIATLLLGAALALASERAPTGETAPPPSDRTAPAGASTLEVCSQGAVVYRAEGARVLRIDERGERALDSSDGAGPGRVLALAVHPAGTVYVAGENGLYCTSPEVELLDPLGLSDGAPAGRPIGLACEGFRLWILTESELGVVETRQRFGRCLGPEDKLPAGPFLGLRREGERGLLVRTAQREWAYRFDRGPRPTIALLRAGGFVPESGARVPAVHGERVPLELEGEGTGGVSYRWRIADHHLWRALDAERPELPALEPGTHAIELCAFDRDLRRSEPARFQLRVAYPQRFKIERAVPLALGVVALAGLTFFLRALRAGGGRERTGRALLSSALFGLVGLQLLVALVPHGRSWPFVGFTMYTEHYDAFDQTYKQSLYPVRFDGTRYEHRPYSAGYAQFEFKRTMAPLVHGGPETRREFLRVFNRQNESVRGYLVLDERYRLTTRGPRRVAPVVLAFHPPELFAEVPRASE